MVWADAIPSVLLALAVLYWPCPLLLTALRLPPLASVAIAPPIAVVVLVTSAVLADLTASRWGPGWILAVAVSLALGLAAARWLIHRHRADAAPPQRSPKKLGTYGLGMVLAAGVLCPGMLASLVGPTAFSQRYDNVFHLNAAHLAAAGHGSPFNLFPVTNVSFYPSAWHDWVGAVVQLGSPGVLVATQACTVVVMFVVWPLSLAWLVETVLQPSVNGRLVLGPLALSAVAYPLMLTGWGTLYPNLLGLALGPVLFTAAWDLLGRRATPALGLGSALSVTILSAVGVALAHPNALLTVALLLYPAVVVAVMPLVRRGNLRAVRGSRLLTLGTATLVVLMPAAWYVLGASIADSSIRDPFTTVSRAVAEAVAGTSMGRPPVASLTIGLALGLLAVAFLPGLRHLLMSYALASALYVGVAALETSRALLLVTAPYYSDPYRIAAASVLITIPLAVLGYDTLARIISDAVPSKGWPMAAALLAVVVAVVTTTSDGTRVVQGKAHEAFRADADSLVLTPDERALIERLATTTEPDAKLVVNPYQGGSLAYAIADRAVTHYYMNTQASPDAEYVTQHLRNVIADPHVCEAVSATGARYALVLEGSEMNGPTKTGLTHPGLRGLATAEGFTRVDAEGESVLYRISACD